MQDYLATFMEEYVSSRVTTAPVVAIMINQGNEIPNKTLVMETKSKNIKQNESAVLQK